MTQGSCPSCGAAVVFSAGSAQVVVCGHCQTVVARQGLQLEARGKVGTIVDTDSPLRLGAEGRVEGAGFRLVGHLQKDHGAGPWDEWFAQFDDGQAGWLSESEGAFHLMRASGHEPERALKELPPGQRFSLQGVEWVVEERGHGRVVAAEGQLPDEVDPSRDGRYVDATGPDGAFLTLDFGSRYLGADVFIGRTHALEALGIATSQLRPRVKQVALQQARCTNCNGALELRAPDLTRRVACPYCGALLDASRGRLAFLQMLEKPPHAPLVPLGARGRLKDVEWVCIGFLVRSCTVEDVRYPWEEYLLFNRERGFAWLMNSTGHWVLLTSLDAGAVGVAPDGKAAHLEGTRYRAFQRVTAVTEVVLGEFYWEVRAGETARAEEYVAPPYSVNVERTEKEVTYTKGEYLPPERVREAFGLGTPMPPVRGVAPSQPNPFSSGSTWKWTGLWLGVLLALYFGVNALSSHETLLTEEVHLAEEAQSGTPSAMHFSEPFEIHPWNNLRVQLDAPLSNTWLGVQSDLVEEASGEVISFYEEVGYYSGVDDEGAWSEGSSSTDESLSRVPPGRYLLRTTAFFESTAERRVTGYTVRMVSDSPRALWFYLALGALLLGPLLATMRKGAFESRRWSESNLDIGAP